MLFQMLGQAEMSIPVRASAYRNHHTDTLDQLQMTTRVTEAQQLKVM